MSGLTFVVASFLLALAAAQNIPSPLNNGNSWMLGNDATIAATPAGTTAVATVMIGTTSGTLTFSGNGASTTGVGTEYWGRLAVSVSIFTVNVGMCVRITPVSGSTTVAGLTYRSNETTVSGITANIVSGPSNPTTQAQSCNAGGFRVEYERSALDLTSGSFTPNACPSALQYAFTNYSVQAVGAGWTCGAATDTANGVTSGQLTFSTGSCPAGASFFTSGSMMHCLHQWTANSITYVNFANATSAPIEFYCAAYASPSAGQVEMTIVKDLCDPAQTTSSVGSAMSGMGLGVKMTYVPSVGTTGQSAGSQVISSFVVLATCLAAALQKLS